MKPIRIVDRPCGTGKTSDLLTSFKPHEKYIVIVPYLTEVDRVVSDAVCDFYAPQVDEESPTKRQSLLELAIEGKNIATTHKMFESLVSICRQGYLDDYNLIIDEVPETIKVAYTLSKASINDIYLNGGYLDVDSKGLVKLTPKWEQKQEEFKDTLSSKLMAQASTGCLYLSENQFFLWCMPIELLTSCFSTTILTYKSGGQNPTALKNLRARQLVGIEPNDIMLTCSKDLWTDEPRGRGIKVGSRLYQANWIANTTRGTNAYAHCSHALYLYDQHLNPAIVRWLNVENKGLATYLV